ncbi:hypothetical protein HN604_04065 [archaeon]|jgi:hypothetical protein|nr:hypothetical protein [archaeon]MBT6182388.1 hypothetical protein [archaeon]MBT6606392.1 hypothetical protein [archaeon]MBT7251439.1 hypothetical protein [archaeon]MBT7661224.1 hypothetical protein [archaeon]
MVIEVEKQSKALGTLKKGDAFFINGKEMKVDSHYLFQKHKDMKEMIIEVFNPANDREYQVRYFDDQIESSIEIYELQEDIQYVRREPKNVGW